MAKFDFKCPQCGESIEADDSFRGQVAECPSCGKGIVVPHADAATRYQSRLRPVTRVLPPVTTSTPNRVTEFERMAEKEAERRRKDRLHKTMLMFIKVVIALVALGGGFIWWNKMKTEERVAKQAAEREESERKLRLIEEEKEKKDSTVNALHAYLEREEARLKEVIEGAKIAQEAIGIDQKEISEELESIEKEDARLAALSKKRREKRYDKAEYVMLILKSQEVGKLYEKYCGEDLTAVRAKYENEVNAILKLHRESTARLRANKEKYRKAIAGIDEAVDAKALQARRRLDSANKEAATNLRAMEKRRAKLMQEMEDTEKGRISAGALSAKARKEKIQKIAEELVRLDEMINTAKAVVSGRNVDYAQQDTQAAETSARRKYDTALEIRQSDDNDVHSDMQHESNVYHIAGRYEQMTLDKLRTAMRISSEFQAAKAAEARRKLDFITRSTANLELMKAEEVENVRKKIVARLAEDVIDDRETKMQKPEEEQ